MGGGRIAGILPATLLGAGRFKTQPRWLLSRVREDALSVGCKSPRCGAIPHEVEGNCVVDVRRRGGEQPEAKSSP